MMGMRTVAGMAGALKSVDTDGVGVESDDCAAVCVGPANRGAGGAATGAVGISSGSLLTPKRGEDSRLTTAEGASE